MCVPGLSKAECVRRSRAAEKIQFSRGRNLRERPRVNYTEPEEPKDDHYLCKIDTLALSLPLYLSPSLLFSLPLPLLYL